jgi:hypothetical protein
MIVVLGPSIQFSAIVRALTVELAVGPVETVSASAVATRCHPRMCGSCDVARVRELAEARVSGADDVMAVVEGDEHVDG